MQAPATLNLTCYQGATFDYLLTWKTNGTAVDLTNYSARMQVRDTYEGATAIFNLTSGTGITLGGTAGTIFLEIDAASTAGAADGQYAYDLELVYNGNVTRLVEGTFIIDPEVTR